MVQMRTIGYGGWKRTLSRMKAERPDVLLMDALVSESNEPAAQGRLTIFTTRPQAVRLQLGSHADQLGSPNLLRETHADEIDTYTDYQYLAEGGVGGSECLATKAHELHPETESAMNAQTADPFGSPWHEASLNGSTVASFQPGTLAKSFDEYGGDGDCIQSR